ncbi:MAG: DUF1343 domain-containing protein [Bacteroidales bacterium]|jgi:uncharacterized protein YbbC (DUF1343 family)|nr:DUF1343 domain-containing protein [Bacteroidales bacterium]
MKKIIFIFLMCGFGISLHANHQSVNQNEPSIVCGAERTDLYLPLLQGKRVGIVANQTSVVGKTHLIDTLLSYNIDIVRIYTPEHGFRGDVEAGGNVNNSRDKRTGLEIVSLYGRSVKPSRESMQGIDLMVFDIQDVGCRFYTYISTLHYVMEACAENAVPLAVLDRPNPNGYFIGGCVLHDTSLVSFVGMHPVPVVYGMTIGEYAQMINGEHWLGTSKARVTGEKGNLHCDLIVIPLRNYFRKGLYPLSVAPSPNLRTLNAVLLYPYLCFFEGTPVSVGRGTDFPFEIIGYPNYKCGDKSDCIDFTPRSSPYKDTLCCGEKLSVPEVVAAITDVNSVLSLFGAVSSQYEKYPAKDKFFQPFFDKLAGSKDVKEAIKGNINIATAETKWQQEIRRFKQIRQQYLLYGD